MCVSDFAIPILGFILAVLSARELKEKVSTKKIIELIVGILIMGFSIWASVGNSESLNSIMQAIITCKQNLMTCLKKEELTVITTRYFKNTLKTLSVSKGKVTSPSNYILTIQKISIQIANPFPNSQTH